VYRKKKDTQELEYLMIRRKDSIGYVEFLRGKYHLLNKKYLLNIISEMTIEEKDRLLNNDFSVLWTQLWSENINSQYRCEEKSAFDKFNALKQGVSVNKTEYNLEALIKESTSTWMETEWGFPKGRHNHQEKDLLCALREFEEETGYSRAALNIVENLLPFEEIFTGSNYKSYKHKYFLAYMAENDVADVNYQRTEVSKIEWKTYAEAMKAIRCYNLEKKDVLTKINTLLSEYELYTPS
jgi:8-oxo-dGTP pyrophosphatase MutT (NUDIX family)